MCLSTSCLFSNNDTIWLSFRYYIYTVCTLCLPAVMTALCTTKILFCERRIMYWLNLLQMYIMSHAHVNYVNVYMNDANVCMSHANVYMSHANVC